jgi:hypothetical protein
MGVSKERKGREHKGYSNEKDIMYRKRRNGSCGGGDGIHRSRPNDGTSRRIGSDNRV